MAVDYSRVYGVELVPNGDPSRVLPVQAPRGIPYILSQSGIPMVIPSSGTIGNNGALTLTTAISSTYAGSCYLYFPDNAIAAGVAAGLYYTVVAAPGTTGTIYNNTYTGGTPTIPASPTPFVTTGPGAYTQSTAEVTLVSVTVPGGALGVNGSIRYGVDFHNNNSANTKTMNRKFGGQVIAAASRTTTTNEQYTGAIIRNRGADNRQLAWVSGVPVSSGTSTLIALTVDTSTNASFVFSAQLSNALDYVMTSGFTVEVLPS